MPGLRGVFLAVAGLVGGTIVTIVVFGVLAGVIAGFLAGLGLPHPPTAAIAAVTPVIGLIGGGLAARRAYYA